MPNNYFNAIYATKRLFIDLFDLKLLCSDRITSSDSECQDFICILPILDGINNALIANEGDEPYEEGEIIQVQLDKSKVDDVFNVYYKDFKKNIEQAIGDAIKDVIKNKDDIKKLKRNRRIKKDIAGSVYMAILHNLYGAIEAFANTEDEDNSKNDETEEEVEDQDEETEEPTTE